MFIYTDLISAIIRTGLVVALLLIDFFPDLYKFLNSITQNSRSFQMIVLTISGFYLFDFLSALKYSMVVGLSGY